MERIRTGKLFRGHQRTGTLQQTRSMKEERNRKRAQLAVVLGLAALALAAMAFGIGSGLHVREIENLVRGMGIWGVAASVGLMVLHSFLPFPAEMLALANGMVYGLFWGTVITWSGAMLGATVAFAIARAAGRPLVERMVGAAQLASFDRRFERFGVPLLLLSRLLPVISFNLVNYAAGLTRISLWTFLWTTGLGILGPTIGMVALGDNLERIELWMWAALLLAMALLVPFWRWTRRQL